MGFRKSSVAVVALVTVLAACAGRGFISGAVPTFTANNLVGKKATDVIEVLGEPDGVGPNELYYGSNTRFYRSPTATTRIIGNTAYTTVYPGGYFGGTCLWTFYLNNFDTVLGWDKRGSDCSTIY